MMLDLKYVRTHIEEVKESLEKRHSSLSLDIFLELDERRRKLLFELETLQAKRNLVSPEIAKKKKSGEDTTDIMAEMSIISERVKVLNAEVSAVEKEEEDWLLSVPNMPHESVPYGKSEEDNRIERYVGEKPSFSFSPKEHFELAADKLDFERAAKITGARFVLYRKELARLERALANFMLDVHASEHGYEEVIPPYIVNRASLIGTGNLPKFADDLFKLENWDYFLIPTAEVPVTNIYRDETIAEEMLPLAFCALTPCFRSEAGSYGRDTKGLIRQHQFHKVEMVRFSHPDNSFEQLELMISHAENILKKLGLHYRVITLCTGDMGFSARKTYDIEVWLPGQDKYREISSCSNTGDFQARRANIRVAVKGEKKKLFAHTLNGSGLAVGRALVAILENYQQADGSIIIPEVLQSYMRGLKKIEKD